ncbi:hypothetical protein DTO169E5_3218 [Paecilomyces variotii]|nr:hypothetical protein DTO169E5_3218 [Paecilomyces variotii]
MRPIFGLTFIGLTSLVQGLTITSPKAGDVVSLSGGLVIRWTHNAEDPNPIGISLVNNSTNFARQLASHVDTTLDSYAVSLNQGYVGNGYQIALIPMEPGNGDKAGFSGKFQITQ